MRPLDGITVVSLEQAVAAPVTASHHACFLARTLRRILVVFAVLAGTGAGNALADGKLYAADVWPEIPDQRALILFDGARQAMVLQSRFAVPEGKQFAGAVGWVVPVPTEPMLGSMSAMYADRLFRQAARRTGPDEYSILPLVALLAVVTLIYLLVVGIGGDEHRRGLRAAAIICLIGSLLASVSLGSFQAVEVVKEMRVGAYDAKVLRAGSSADLIGWFKHNGFAFTEADSAALDGYIKRSWLFVTARFAPDTNESFGLGGMSPPLLVRFDAKSIVYPLVLTATAGRATEVALYVYAPYRADAGDRLSLRFAGHGSPELNWFREYVTPVGFFDAIGFSSPPFLTKLKGKLKPVQMREDLTLAAAPDNKSYRETSLTPMSMIYGGYSLGVGILALLMRISRRPYFRAIKPLYHLLISLFLTPLAGILFLVVHAVRDWRQWRGSALRMRQERLAGGKSPDATS